METEKKIRKKDGEREREWEKHQWEHQTFLRQQRPATGLYYEGKGEESKMLRECARKKEKRDHEEN